MLPNGWLPTVVQGQNGHTMVGTGRQLEPKFCCFSREPDVKSGLPHSMQLINITMCLQKVNTINHVYQQVERFQSTVARWLTLYAVYEFNFSRMKKKNFQKLINTQLLQTAKTNANKITKMSPFQPSEMKQGSP